MVCVRCFPLWVGLELRYNVNGETDSDGAQRSNLESSYDDAVLKSFVESNRKSDLRRLNMPLAMCSAWFTSGIVMMRRRIMCEIA